MSATFGYGWDPGRLGSAGSMGNRLPASLDPGVCMATFVPPEPGGHTTLDECQEEVDDLRMALATRPVIDQAKGVLIARHGCTPDQAFEMLTDASQRANVKVREIAARIVSSMQDGTDDPIRPSPPTPGSS